MKILTLLLVLHSMLSYSEELRYPELNVTPRAKARIKLELREEAGTAWSSHLMVQLSSILTLTSGIMSTSSLDSTKPKNEMAPTIAIGIGSAWLAATAWTAMNYRPYRDFYSKIKKMPYKTKRHKLTAERLAEERINSLRSIGKKVRWASVISNFAASANLLENVKDESDAQAAASFSVLLSIAPLFFTYHWEDVAKEQERYKKKIFAPVAMFPLLKNPFNQERTSGISLLYRF